MRKETNLLEIANQLIEIGRKLKNEDTMSAAESVQTPPPSGVKAKRKRRIQELVNRRLAKVDH